MGEESKEVYALKLISFFKGGKNDESCWTEAQCGFWVASQESAAHLPCCLSPWEEGEIMEQEHRRQQPTNQQQPGARRTCQTLTPAPWSPSRGAVDPGSDADQ